jgi:hypothetical protein
MRGDREIDMRNALGIGMAVWVLAFACGSAAATEMTASDYKAAKKHIEAEYEVERQKCGVRYGNALDLGAAHAHGIRDVAKAELEAAYKPGARTNYDAAVARAKAAYANTRVECDQLQPVAKKACIKDARSARDGAKAQAEVIRKKARAEERAKPH